MIYSLRKTHRRIWVVWSILLPLIFTVVLLRIPVNDPVDNRQNVVGEAQAWMEVSKMEGLDVSRRELETDLIELKVSLTKPFRSPFVMVYQNDINDGVLGKIDGIGDYYFRVYSDCRRLVFFDEITAETLLTMEIN